MSKMASVSRKTQRAEVLSPPRPAKKAAVAVEDEDDEMMDAPGGLTELSRPTALTTALYGSDVIAAAAEQGIGARAILEETNAVQQCKAVIGDYKFGVTPCWICGFAIKDTPGLKPECEHVLPVAQGAFLLSLYTPRKDKRAEAEMWKIEYAWAHRVCNQVKSATHFLKPGTTRRYEVDNDRLVSFLQELQTLSDAKYDGGGGELKTLIRGRNTQLGASGNTWLEERRKVITERINTAISRFPREEENLALLGSTAALMDPYALRDIVPEPPAAPVRLATASTSGPAKLSDEAAADLARKAMWVWFSRWVEPTLIDFINGAVDKKRATSALPNILTGLRPSETSQQWVLRQPVTRAVAQYNQAYSSGRTNVADAILTEVAMYDLAKTVSSALATNLRTLRQSVSSGIFLEQLKGDIEREVAAASETEATRLSMGQIQRGARRIHKTRRRHRRTPHNRKPNPNRTHKRTK